MRSAPDDRTARAVIRDEALRLFAEHGPDAVSVRQVAAAAGVSPGLVIHHFGAKDGLRDAVDAHVLALFGAMLAELATADLRSPDTAGSLAEAVVRYLPPDSPVPGYLRRLLLAGGDPGRELVRGLFEASRAALEAMCEAGLADRGADPAVRAAILMSNDLAVLLLREQLADVVGEDPLTTAGMTRWGREMLAIYTAGLMVIPPPGEEPPGSAGGQR
jgi:AcrR family transcriptional regulator